MGLDNVYEVTVRVSDGAGGTATQAIRVTVVDVQAMILDQFNAVSYGGNDGNQDWSDNWTEVGEPGSPALGVLQVNPSGYFRFGGDEVSLTGKSLSRRADLSGATQATLSLNYQRVSIDGGGGSVSLRISPDGGLTWTTLRTYSLSSFDAGFVSDTFDVSAFATANTIVQFLGSGSTEAYLQVDDVRIEHNGSAMNSAPVITSNGGGDQAYVNVNENTTAVTTVTAVDANLPGQTLTFSIVGGADAVRFAIDPSTGALRFVSPPDFETPTDVGANDVYEVIVQVGDGNGGTDLQELFVTVLNVNEAPVASNDGYGTSMNVPLPISAPGVLANDVDPEKAPLFAVLVTLPSNGVLLLGPDGSFLYSPFFGFSGIDSFTYVASDLVGNSNVATVTINVGVSNAPPNAANDSHVVNEDATLNVGAPGVLGNDSDPNSDPLTAVLVSGPSNGALLFNADGSFTYTPNANFHGVDSFTYRADDGMSPSNLATVTITVNSVNDAPIAGNDGYSVNQGGTLNVAPVGLLLNDADVDGDPLTAALVGGPSNGSLFLNADGSFTYTPNPAFSGTDGFTYRTHDGMAFSSVATVTITVTPVNGAPVANDESYSVDEDGALNVAASGVLANDFDGEGDPLTAVLVSGPSNGSLFLNANGSFTYTPNANYNGVDSFTYKANDGVLDSNVVTVTIFIDPVNDAPVANDESYSIDEDGALNVPIGGVIGNDVDVDDDPLTAVLVSGPSNGSLFLNANGSFTYTPNANYNGVDSFTYKVNDGFLDSNVATVTITVNPVNDAPVASDESYSIDEDGALNVAASGVLANDTDVDGDPLTAVLVSGPSNGSLFLNADGSFTYTPNANFNGVDSFTYKVNDGFLDSNVATVTITVNPVNDAPERIGGALNDLTVLENSASTSLGLGGLDYRPGPGGTEASQSLTHTVTAVPPASLGRVLLADGVTVVTVGTTYSLTQLQGMRFQPSPDAFGGPEIFSFRVRDDGGTFAGGLDTLDQSLSISVTRVNAPPSHVVPGAQAVNQYATRVFSQADGNAIVVDDTDAGLNPIRVALSVSQGSLSLATTSGLTIVAGADGGPSITVEGTVADVNVALDGLVYTPTLYYHGPDSLLISTDDLGNTGVGGPLTASDSVAITVHYVATAPSVIVGSSLNPAVYGGSVTFTATVSAAYATPTGTVTFLDGSTVLGSASLGGGVATFTTSSLLAGVHDVTALYSGDGLFLPNTSPIFNQSVAPATLIVRANDATMIYGEALPGLSATYDGWVNGDSPGSLGGALDVGTTFGPGSPIGAYALRPSGLTSSNYAIQFVDGTLTVLPASPTVTGASVAATELVPFTGNVATFPVLDATPTPGDYTAVIHWGDGRVSTGVIGHDAGTGTYVVRGTNAYGAPGRYTIQITIQGINVNPASTTGSAVVADAPLDLTAVNVSAKECEVFRGVVATFRDQGVPGRPSDYSALIEWGNGESTPGVVRFDALQATFVVEGAMRYRAEGVYPVRVEVRARDGAVAVATGLAAVADAPLLGYETTVRLETRRSFGGIVASFVDMGTPNRAEDYAATIDWGDGTSTRGTVVPNADGGFDVLGTHTYETPGRRAMTITIVGAGGSEVTVNTVARVVSPWTYFTVGGLAPVVEAPPLANVAPPAAPSATAPVVSAGSEAPTTGGLVDAHSIGVLGAVPIMVSVPMGTSSDGPAPAPDAAASPASPPAETGAVASPSTENGAGVESVLNAALDIALRQFAEVLRTLVGWGDEGIGLRVGLNRGTSLPGAPALFSLEQLQAQLDEIILEMGPKDANGTYVMILGTGMVVSVGYTFLQSRACYFLLSLLTAKPLWNEYDPLAILLDWEREQNQRSRAWGKKRKARSREDEESLQTIIASARN
ncbi:MAG: Ig-like domain-containing protein [Isosphaeraceae bacterium]